MGMGNMEETTEKKATSESDADGKPEIDTGLHCLVMIAQYHGVAADAEQMRHEHA